MSMMGGGPARPTRQSGDDDLYTALIGVSCLFVLGALIFIIIRSVSLFNSVWPPGGG